jgi:hypothetical protein
MGVGESERERERESARRPRDGKTKGVKKARGKE